MTKRTILLSSKGARQRAHALIDAAPEGYAVTVGEETRSQAQNRLLWPLIADIKRQVPAMAAFAPDDIKTRFLNALGVEMRWLPELDGAGTFPVGLKSSTLTVAQFSLLTELLFKYGAEHDVLWSEPQGIAA